MNATVERAKKVPRRGDFQWFSMSGAFEPSVKQAFSTRGYFGLEPEGTYFWGTFRDDDGGVYVFMRRMPFGRHTEPPPGKASLGRRAVLFSYKPGTAEFAVHPSSMESGYNTQQTIAIENDALVFQSNPDNKGKAFRGEYRTDRIFYKEEGMLELSGLTLVPGLHWHIPGRDIGKYDTHHTFMVDGTILGKKVHGFLFFEQAYMIEGAVMYTVNDLFVGQQMHLTWYSFCNQYDDGDIEFGHFVVGHDRMGFAIASDNKSLILQSSNISAEVDRSADGFWADRVRLDVDGEAWEVIMPPELRMLPTSHMPNGQQEGYVQRVGETRKRVRWMAWGETAPSHGDRRVYHYADRYRLLR